MGKQDDIINTAKELFSHYGFKKVSMDEIAKKSGVTKKTIYHYYTDKQELFQYFIDEELRNMKQKIEANANKEESFLEKVTDDLKSILTISKGNELLSSLIRERNEEKIHGPHFFQVYEDKIIDYIDEKVSQEIANGNIRECNSHLTAFIIYKTIFSIIFEYDQEVDKEKVIKEVTSILTDGLLIKGGLNNEK